MSTHHTLINIMTCTLLLFTSCGKDTQYSSGTDMGWNLSPDEGQLDQADLIDASVDLGKQVEDQGKDTKDDTSADMSKVWEVPEGMVEIPEGSFLMGADGGDAFLNGESPQHEVFLSRYAIDRFEVTAQEYALCVDAGQCEVPPFDVSVTEKEEWCNYGRQERGEHPMNCLNWYHADAYCKWAGKLLPTEAQWEKAARGTDASLYPWGDEEPSCDLLVMDNCRDGEGTIPVEQSLSDVSVYGVHNLLGHVEEWTLNFSYNYDNSEETPRNPTGPESGEQRAFRGGSVDLVIPYVPSSLSRFTARSETQGAYRGFRCAYNGPQSP